MRFVNTMPGVAVVGHAACPEKSAGGITDFSGQAASPTMATPGMVLTNQYEDYGRGSP